MSEDVDIELKTYGFNTDGETNSDSSIVPMSNIINV